MDYANALLGLFFLALLVEGITDYFVAAPLKQKGFQTWWVRYAALVVGVAAAFGFRANLPAVFGLKAVADPVSYVATGIVFSRGANYLSDILGRLVDLLKNVRKP